MKTRFLALAPLGLAFVFGVAQAQAPQTPRTVYLFNTALGKAPASALGAKTGVWGNGIARRSRNVVFDEQQTLEITSRNFSEGARFDLTQPFDPDAFREKGFVRLRLRFTEGAAGAGGEGLGGEGGRPGGFEGQRNATNFQMRPNDGRAPLPGFGDPGFGQPGGEDGTLVPQLPAQTTNISELKITFLRENGAMSGRLKIDLEATTPDEDGWRLFAVPINQMTSTAGASGPVKRILLTSDVEDTFYVAQMAVVIETGEMEVSIRSKNDPVGTQIAEIEAKPGAPLTLYADVEAGAADPQVEWNFDADKVGNLPPSLLNAPALGGVNPTIEGDIARPNGRVGPPTPGRGGGVPVPGGELGGGVGAEVDAGPRVDARGLSATFTYPNEEQNYRVEVTVRDRSGVKKPVTASVLVKIRG